MESVSNWVNMASEPTYPRFYLLLLFCERPPMCWSFSTSSCRAKMGDYDFPQFPVAAALYLSTELLSQENWPRNGGLATVLSGSSP